MAGSATLSPKLEIDVEGFRRRLVENLVESGVDPRSPYLAPLYKMIDDDVSWYIASLRAKDDAKATPDRPAN